MQAVKPLRIVKEQILNIQAPPSEVFPLLCPLREYEWVETWRCDLLYTQSGRAENNCIFETDFAHNGGKETWVVSRYEKDRCIEFVRFTANEKVVKLDIDLVPVGERSTRMTWRKIYTGLGLAGNQIITRIAEVQFDMEAAQIERMLNHYLTTGEMLRNQE